MNRGICGMIRVEGEGAIPGIFGIMYEEGGLKEPQWALYGRS